MFEKVILKQILIFNLEAKFNTTKNLLEKTNLKVLIEKLRKEVMK